MKHLLSILCFVFCLLPFTAFTDPVSLKINTPPKWETVEADVNASRTKVFVDPSTESRIEVFSKELAKDSQADLFFKAIDAQLQQSNFKTDGELQNKNITLSNGKKRSGKEGLYKYDLSEVPVNVQTFAFNEDTTAYIVVCYYSPTHKDATLKVFEDLLKNMTKTGK
ncbi:MAG: hypothetical protein II767_07640 [Proteobacteria bacterium]|nr:hypothetical protein [Pseudomonadota bacterium]